MQSEYVSSCIGPGEDGVLTYDNFCVYRYKDLSARKDGAVFTQLRHSPTYISPAEASAGEICVERKQTCK